MDPESVAREIAERAKAVRKPLPRGVWILGLGVGIAGAIAAIVMITRTPSTPPARRPIVESGSGLEAGIAIGLVVGIGIGFALGYRRRA